MSKEITVLDKINSCYNELFDAEKRVADYILAHSDKVIDMTVSELSEESEASKATIVRLCKKCDCEGFYHLKIKMAKEMINNSDTNTSNEELKQTLSNIDIKSLNQIIKHIDNANLVLFAAQGNTIPIALDAAYKFNEIGITSFSAPIIEHQLVLAHKLTKNDVVIAISASGESKNLLNVIDAALEKNATVISITNSAKSTLALKAKYHIQTISRERLFFPEFSFVFSRLAAMSVLETLFFLLAKSKINAQEYIDLHEQSMANDKN